VGIFLVAGATSTTGRQIVGSLLARGRAVRALVRREADGADFAARGATVALGDVRDPAAVRRACDGVETVVSLVGRHFARTQEGLWEVDAAGNEGLVRAAVAAGAKRFVLLSALWADRDLPPFLFRAKRHAEQALIASGLRYAILRPSTFVVGPSSLIGAVAPTIERWGFAVIPGPDSGPVSFIVEKDVAEALVTTAVDDDGTNRIVELGGPEDLTLGDSARRVAGVLGRRVRLVRIPRVVLRAGRKVARRGGFGAYEALLFLEMIADVGYHCDPSGTRALLGRPPTPVDEALREYYATHKLTPWGESNLGVLRTRGT
jgi:uncharacterized protein YbjT (DUF2867 family)